MSAFALRGPLVQFALVVGLVAGGALGIMVLLDPRAQAFWGTRFSELGTAVRLFQDALPRLDWLPFSGRP